MCFSFDLIHWYFYTINYTNFTILTILPELLVFIMCIIILLLNIYNYRPLYLFNYIIFFFFGIINYYIFLIYNYDLYFHIHFLNSTNGLFDFYSIFFKAFILLLTFISLLIAKNTIYTLQNKVLNEFLLLLLFSVFFILILFSVSDFFSAYLALEGMSFSLYILASTVYYNKLSLESSIKYFILGGIASCILLYGISLLLIITNSLDFFIIKYYLVNNYNFIIRFDLIWIIICVLISFCFKLSIFPCHMWSPDVYEGIWTPITVYFILVIKSAMFIFFSRIFCYIFSNILHIWQPFVLISGLGSIIIGSLGALHQHRIKKFFAYTSINQIGFLIIGMATCDINGLAASFGFLFIYIIMNIVFFAILLNTEHFTHQFKINFLTDLYALDYYNSKITLLWTVTMFSMAGIPPTAGFFTKFYILITAVNHFWYWIIIIILLSTMLSVYYYLIFIKYLVFEKKRLINLYFIDYNITIINHFFIFVGSLLLIFLFFFPFFYHLNNIIAINCKFPLSNDSLFVYKSDVSTLEVFADYHE